MKTNLKKQIKQSLRTLFVFDKQHDLINTGEDNKTKLEDMFTKEELKDGFDSKPVPKLTENSLKLPKLSHKKSSSMRNLIKTAMKQSNKGMWEIG